MDRDTTIRTFFKSDLLQQNLDAVPPIDGLKKLQQSLIYYADPQKNKQQKQDKTTSNEVAIDNMIEDYNWLTAEDIFNAAQDVDSKITHSPIVLIPYEDSQPVPEFELSKEPYDQPFTIFEDLSLTSKDDTLKSEIQAMPIIRVFMLFSVI